MPQILAMKHGKPDAIVVTFRLVPNSLPEPPPFLRAGSCGCRTGLGLGRTRAHINCGERNRSGAGRIKSLSAFPPASRVIARDTRVYIEKADAAIADHPVGRLTGHGFGAGQHDRGVAEKAVETVNAHRAQLVLVDLIILSPVRRRSDNLLRG